MVWGIGSVPGSKVTRATALSRWCQLYVNDGSMIPDVSACCRFFLSCGVSVWLLLSFKPILAAAWTSDALTLETRRREKTRRLHEVQESRSCDPFTGFTCVHLILQYFTNTAQCSVSLLRMKSAQTSSECFNPEWWPRSDRFLTSVWWNIEQIYLHYSPITFTAARLTQMLCLDFIWFFPSWFLLYTPSEGCDV